MKFYKICVLALLMGLGQAGLAQGSTLSTQQATDTLTRIFMKHTADEMVSSQVVTEMFYTDAPAVRIDSMYYEVLSMKGNYYITIDHDVSYMHNKHWNVSVYRSQRAIIADSLEHQEGAFSFKENPFSIYEEFLKDTTLLYSYAGLPGDTSKLTILASQPDQFQSISLFYSRSNGSLFRGEYILPLPETPAQELSDTATASLPVIPPNRAYLMKMHYAYENLLSTSGAFFSEASFFARLPDGSYVPSTHFPGYMVTRRQTQNNY
jgi:hypothetical protein